MSYPGSPPPSALWRLARPLMRAAEGLVFPPVCVACAEPLPAMAERHEEANWFCKACLNAIEPQLPPYCSKCGEMYDGSFTNTFRCSNCEGLTLEFDFAVAACAARGPVRELIHRFKYGRRLHLRASLAVLLSRVLEEERLRNENLCQWLLVPVPLHPERESDREFNQSWELCVRLAQITGIPAAQVLERIYPTVKQAQLNRRQRQENLRGAFRMRQARWWQRQASAPPDIQGRKILLVDDVLTTGSTTSECARVLKNHGGAEKVVVITVARG
jgi:competence protein ComFC